MIISRRMNFLFGSAFLIICALANNIASDYVEKHGISPDDDSISTEIRAVIPDEDPIEDLSCFNDDTAG